MTHLGSMPDPAEKPRTLLAGWISRLDLALELGLSVDTLRRWECQRRGPLGQFGVMPRPGVADQHARASLAISDGKIAGRQCRYLPTRGGGYG